MTSPNIKSNEDIFKEFLSLVAQNYANEHELSFYATSLGISTRHLNKVTCRIAGCTPKTIIDARLIHEARLFLKKTKLSMLQISDRLGFSSQVTFSRLFKRIEGVPPLKFRFT